MHVESSDKADKRPLNFHFPAPLFSYPDLPPGFDAGKTLFFSTIWKVSLTRSIWLIEYCGAVTGLNLMSKVAQSID